MLVIGIGNDFRRDDGCGREVARRLRERFPEVATIVECDGEVAHLLGLWRSRRRVIVVDAIRSGSPAGTVRRIVPRGDDLMRATRGAGSTHGLSLAQALGLADALGRRPDRFELIGIEGADYEVGPGLSPEVEAAAERVVELLGAELAGRPAGPE